jgi:hypothetical protein
MHPRMVRSSSLFTTAELHPRVTKLALAVVGAAAAVAAARAAGVGREERKSQFGRSAVRVMKGAGFRGLARR